MVPPHPPPVVWCGGGLLPSPPCGVVWCGCGLLPRSLWCGVVRVWALVVPPLHPLWRGMGWVVPLVRPPRRFCQQGGVLRELRPTSSPCCRCVRSRVSIYLCVWGGGGSANREPRYYIYIYIFKRDSNGRNSKMYSYKTLFLHILYTYCTACVCRFSIITCFRAVTYAHIYSLSLCLKARSSIALYTHPTS